MKDIKGHYWVINSQPIGEKHLGWFSKLTVGINGDENISLFEVVERIYPHPNAPNDATIRTTEVLERMTVARNSIDAPQMWMLYHAQRNVRVPESRWEARHNDCSNEC